MDQPHGALVDPQQTPERLSDPDTWRRAIQMCADGIHTEDQADQLVEYHARLQGWAGDEWNRRFIRALRDYLLLRTPPEGALSADNFAWLKRRLAPEGSIRTGGEIDFLIVLLKQAGRVPPGYGLFLLDCACGRLLKGGKADPEDIRRIAAVLTHGSKDGTSWVSAGEAAILLRTNDRLARTGSDPAWNRLYARAMANYLMARAHPHPDSEQQALSRQNWLGTADSHPGQYIGCLALGFSKGRWFETLSASPGQASEARRRASEAASDQAVIQNQKQRGWLLRRLGWDKAGEADRALIDFLNQEAPGMTAGLVAATA